jgi:hypothetical protein
MNALEIAQCYFDAWNRRDAEAIVGAFARSKAILTRGLCLSSLAFR